MSVYYAYNRQCAVLLSLLEEWDSGQYKTKRLSQAPVRNHWSSFRLVITNYSPVSVFDWAAWRDYPILQFPPLPSCPTFVRYCDLKSTGDSSRQRSWRPSSRCFLKGSAFMSTVGRGRKKPWVSLLPLMFANFGVKWPSTLHVYGPDVYFQTFRMWSSLKHFSKEHDPSLL